MRIFNRIIMILLLAGLFVLGAYAVAYGFGLLGYQLSSLPLSPIGNSVETFISGVENSALTVLGVAVLVAVAIVGLILLIAELKPPSPKHVRMQKNTYITREVVRNEASQAAEGTPDILGSMTRVKAKRSPGAQINLDANVRRGENLNTIKSNLRESIQERLARSGVPINKLKIKLNESDPRETKTRVQ